MASSAHPVPEPSRRRVAQGLAWSVPTIALAAAAPAMAVSYTERITDVSFQPGTGMEARRLGSGVIRRPWVGGVDRWTWMATDNSTYVNTPVYAGQPRLSSWGWLLRYHDADAWGRPETPGIKNPLVLTDPAGGSVSPSLPGPYLAFTGDPKGSGATSRTTLMSQTQKLGAGCTYTFQAEVWTGYIEQRNLRLTVGFVPAALRPARYSDAPLSAGAWLGSTAEALIAHGSAPTTSTLVAQYTPAANEEVLVLMVVQAATDADVAEAGATERHVNPVVVASPRLTSSCS